MIWILITFLSLLFVIALFLFTPFALDINGFLNFPISGGNNNKADFDFYINIIFFRVIKVKIPYEKIKEFSARRREKERALRARAKGGRGVGGHSAVKGRPPRGAEAAAAAAFRVTLLEIRAAVGAGDSALTALSAGTAYALLAAPAAALFAYTGGAPAAYAVNVEPDFKKIGLRVRGRCILSGKPANIILKYLNYLAKGRNKK